MNDPGTHIAEREVPALVRYAAEGGVARLTLDDAARMNPLSPQLLQECLEALEAVRADASVRVLVLAANGRGFCSGADLAAMGASLSQSREPGQPSLGAQTARLLEEGGHPLVKGLRELPVPVICAMHGAVAGGGVGLVLAADVVVASRSSYFYLPFAPALGLIPDMGSAWFLQRAVGRMRALALALLGDRLTAEQAAQWGLVWRCVDDDALATEVAGLARRLAALPAHAVQELRALYTHAESADLGALLSYERDRQHALIERPDFAEGVRAFLERRTPVFNGRR